MAFDCCAHPKPVWSARRSGEHQYADTLLCGGCGTIHESESFLVPVLLPGPGRCLNCGAPLEPDTLVEDDPTHSGFRCEQCGLHDRETLQMHQELAEEIAPNAILLEAALAALDVGRQVRALKLASAALRDNPDSAEARAVRLQTLEGLGYGESAVREAWRWAQERDAPDVAWTITADLERTSGNIEGALRAMQRLLRRAPGDRDLWMEYAELLLEGDERATAIDAAAHGLADDEHRDAALAIIAEIAQRCVNDGQLDHTRKAFETAGDFGARHAGLVWVRAQLAAREQNLEEALRWLQRTLDLDPTYREAKEALERIKPPDKRRWRFW